MLPWRLTPSAKAWPRRLCDDSAGRADSSPLPRRQPVVANGRAYSGPVQVARRWGAAEISITDSAADPATWLAIDPNDSITISHLDFPHRCHTILRGERGNTMSSFRDDDGQEW